MNNKKDAENPNVSYSQNPDLKFIKANVYGNKMINGRFVDAKSIKLVSFKDLLAWKLGKNSKKNKKRNQQFAMEVETLKEFPEKAENYICWLGHSAFILNLNQTTFLFDPCFYDILMVKRKFPIPCSVEQLDFIDYVLLSHDHLDHFDTKSLKELARNNNFKALTPLNMKQLFKNKLLSQIAVEEAAWYQEYQLTNEFRIVFLPAIHWGRRGLNDFNKILWGGFMLIHKNFKIYFAGDTAYDGPLFQEIHNLFGRIDLCFLPIGAYDPPFIMQSNHMNPEEAYRAFQELEGEYFMPMHYGTYILSDEYLGEPLEKIQQFFSEAGQEKHLLSIKPGEIFPLDKIRRFE